MAPRIIINVERNVASDYDPCEIDGRYIWACASRIFENAVRSDYDLLNLWIQKKDPAAAVASNLNAKTFYWKEGQDYEMQQSSHTSRWRLRQGFYNVNRYTSTPKFSKRRRKRERDRDGR